MAHNELGLELCRKRHIYSISFWGRSRVFGMSMKEERFLIPGGRAEEDSVAEQSSFDGAGGGGGWKGLFIDLIAPNGPVAPGTTACLRKLAIFSR